MVTDRQWSFGDRTPVSAEKNPLHVYSSNGVYTVSLRVAGAGGSDTLTRTQFVTIAETPAADFATNLRSGVRPLTVVFTDTSVGLTTAHAWAFGDGSSSWEQDPVHRYTSAGTYTVSLTALGPCGSNTVIRTNYITVAEPPPVASFSATPTAGKRPLTVSFC